MSSSRAFILSTTLAVLAATSAAIAAPPEVQDLGFDSDTALSWDAAAGAAGYHLYRGPISDLALGNQGACVGGSIPLPATMVSDLPALGEGYFYLTSAYDETGEGVLAVSILGLPYTPQPACVPSRRTFPLIRLTPSDGLPEGDGEPALNSVSETIWQGFLESVEVLPHSGELVVRQHGFGGGASEAPWCYEEDDEDMLARTQMARVFLKRPRGASCQRTGTNPLYESDRLGGKLGTAAAVEVSVQPDLLTPYWLVDNDSDSSRVLRAHGIVVTKPGGGMPNGRIRGGPFSLLGKMAKLKAKIGGIFAKLGALGGTRGGRGDGHGGMLGFLKGKGGRGLAKGGLGGFARKFRVSEGFGPRKSSEYRLSDSTSDPCRVDPLYRSGILYDGPLGQGWDFPANSHLTAQGSAILLHDGAGRVHLFDSLGGGAYRSPRGVFSVLFRNADGSLSLRRSDGVMDTYRALDGSSTAGALVSRTDDASGVVTFLYDHQGLLTTAVDALGRATTFTWDAGGRLLGAAADVTGLTSRFEYDAVGRLVAFTTPEVVGTPNGNDFPSGKRTEYTYETIVADTSLRHNLIAITAPNETANGGPPRVQITYGQDPASFDYDRVTSAAVGTIPFAGGVLAFTYQPVNPGADPADPAVARRHATVLDENGNLREYLHNANGHLLGLLERTNLDLRPGEPDYLTSFTPDAEGRLLMATSPAGTRYDFTWDTFGADRYRQENLLQARVVADSFASGGRGDGHGGELADMIWNFTWEPMRNGPASVTDPLGRVTTFQYDYQEGDPATSGLLTRAARYGVDLGGVPLGLGDLNGDGRDDQLMALPVRMQEPTVTLEPGSNQAVVEGDTTQERVSLRVHDDHGQLVCQTDTMGSRDCFSYFPETDPDGDGSPTPPPPDGRALDPSTGGYLASEQYGIDAVGGATATVSYRRDVRGQVAWRVDPRGVSTVFVHNDLDQVVEVREAASTADAAGPHGDPATGFGEPGLTPLGVRTWYHYDANDNLVRVEREDIGQTRQVGTFESTEYTYDLLGQLASVQEEIAAGVTRTTAYEYDAAGNLTRVTSPEGRADELAWDERHLPMSSTRGASGPFGGTPATCREDFNGSGLTTTYVDARGGLTDYEYDGAGRLVRVRDQIGGTAEWFYDAAGNVTRFLARGSPGGPAPPDRSGATNVSLAETLINYDEGSRPRRRSVLFKWSRSESMMRPPVVQEGPLVPGDGAVNRIDEYDAAGRLTFVTDDMAATTSYAYDVLDRLTTETLADGSSHVFVWNAAADLVQLDNNEQPTISLVPPARYQTSYEYDALGRLTMTVDNAGRSHRFVWNSFDDIGAASDARGPAGGGSIIRNGMVVPINGHGNVTRYAYDGLGRLLRSEQVLTATGEGDGTLTPAPAPTTFNPDGLLTSRMVWSVEDMPIATIDDAGNETLYEYDNLGRIVRVQADDGTATLHGYDTEDNPVTTVNANGSVITRVFLVGGLERPAGAALRQVTINPQEPDDGTTLRQYEYDGLGRVTRAFDNNMPGNTQDDTTVELFYDSLGRILEEQQSLSDGTPTAAIDSQWLGEAQRTAVVPVNGAPIQYGYDSLGRVTSVLDTASGMSATYEYLGPDRLGRRTFGNGVQTTMLDNTGRVPIGYDAAGQLIQMRHRSGSAPAATLLAGFQSAYDAEGNRLFERRGHQPALPGTFLGERFAYDSAGRLTAYDEGPLDAAGNLAGPPSDTRTWDLDGVGNWVQFTRNGVPFGNTPNNLNEYDEPQSGGVRIDDGVPNDFGDNLITPLPDGTNQGHDKSGNQVVDGTLTYRYGTDGHLVWAKRGPAAAPPIAEYTYDAFGRMVAEVKLSGGLSHFRTYYDGPRPVADTRDGMNDGGTVYGAVGEPIIRTAVFSGAGAYLTEGILGSVAAVVPDGGIVVAGRVTYDPVGMPTFEDAASAPLLDTNGNFVSESPLGVKEAFLGMRYDPETDERTADPLTDRGGLYCALGVCYDPDQGRGLTGGSHPDSWDLSPRRRSPSRPGSLAVGANPGLVSDLGIARPRAALGNHLQGAADDFMGRYSAAPRCALRHRSFSVAAITTVQTRGMIAGCSSWSSDFRLGSEPGPPTIGGCRPLFGEQMKRARVDCRF